MQTELAWSDIKVHIWRDLFKKFIRGDCGIDFVKFGWERLVWFHLFPSSMGLDDAIRRNVVSDEIIDSGSTISFLKVSAFSASNLQDGEPHITSEIVLQVILRLDDQHGFNSIMKIP